MDSEWALLEFRPGRYVKVTAKGEVIGRPTDEEIRAWFASRGWGVDSTQGSLSLHLDLPSEPAEEAGETAVLQQITGMPAPGKADSTAAVVSEAPQQLSTPQPTVSGLESLPHGAEEVPFIALPEPDVTPEVPPAEPPQEAQVRYAEADNAETAGVQADELSAVESLDTERPRPESEVRGIGPALALEVPAAELEPPKGESAALRDDVGEVATEHVHEPLAVVAPRARSHDAPVPEPRKMQEAVPVRPESRATPDAVGESAADGTGRWLWVDPRQEGGYSRTGYDSKAFLARAVELFESKPWAGGRNPSRLAVHPDHITEDLESAAEALGLEILGDSRVMAGTYMLGLGDRQAGD